MLGGRFELPILSEHAPKACACTNFATRAYLNNNYVIFNGFCKLKSPHCRGDFTILTFLKRSSEEGFKKRPK